MLEPLAGAALAVLGVALLLHRVSLAMGILGTSFLWGAQRVVALPALSIAAIAILIYAHNVRPPTAHHERSSRHPAAYWIVAAFVLARWALDGGRVDDVGWLYLEIVSLCLFVVAFGRLYAEGTLRLPAVAGYVNGLTVAAWVSVAAAHAEIDTVSFAYSRRLDTAFGSSNYLAVFTTCVAMAALCLARQGYLSRRRMYVAVAPALLLTGLIGTRSVVVAAAVFVVVYAVLWMRNLNNPHGHKRIGWSLLAILCPAMIWFQGSLLATRFDRGYGSSGRVDLWRSGYDAAQTHPLLGSGFTGVVNAIEDVPATGLYLHNSILGLLVAFGAVGLLVIWVFRPPFDLSHLFAPALWAMTALSMLEPSIETLRVGVVYCFLLAIRRIDISRSEAQANTPWEGREHRNSSRLSFPTG